MEINEPIMYQHDLQDAYELQQQKAPPKRLVSAPYLYCTFAWSIILTGVGTYISSSAYFTDSETATGLLKVIGPVLIAIGGLLLFAMCVLCLTAFRINQTYTDVNEALHPVGESTFYENIFNKEPIHYKDKHDDGISFMEAAVTNEIRRNISRKASMKASSRQNLNIDKTVGLNHNDSMIHKSTNPIIQVHPDETLPSKYFQFDQDQDFQPISRYRSASAAAQQRPALKLMQRKLSLNPSQSNFHKLKRMQKRNLLSDDYPPELRYHYQDKSKQFSSLKSKNIRDDSPPVVHQLPSYNPDIIQNLVKSADNQEYFPSISAPVIDPLTHRSNDNIISTAMIEENKFRKSGPSLTWNVRQRDLNESMVLPGNHSFRKKRKKKRAAVKSDKSSDSDIHDISRSRNGSLSSGNHGSNSSTPPPSPTEASDIVRGVILGVDCISEGNSINNRSTLARLSVISEIGNDERR